MCHQSIGLIGGVLEGRGIATVCLSVCEEITRKVGPPRALVLPYPFGYPLGAPGDAGLQHRILDQALALLTRPGPPPVTVEWDAGGATCATSPPVP